MVDAGWDPRNLSTWFDIFRSLPTYFVSSVAYKPVP